MRKKLTIQKQMNYWSYNINFGLVEVPTKNFDAATRAFKTIVLLIQKSQRAGCVKTVVCQSGHNQHHTRGTFTFISEEEANAVALSARFNHWKDSAVTVSVIYGGLTISVRVSFFVNFLFLSMLITGELSSVFW